MNEKIIRKNDSIPTYDGSEFAKEKENPFVMLRH
jgi:hypothetical protein